MPYIVLDEEQAKLISSSSQDIEIRDPKGNHLGFVARGFSDEDIKIAEERMASNEPRYATEQVLDHLRSLEKY